MKIKRIDEFPVKKTGKWSYLGKTLDSMKVGEKIQVTLASVAEAKAGQVYITSNANGHSFRTQIVPQRKNVYLCVERTK